MVLGSCLVGVGAYGRISDIVTSFAFFFLFQLLHYLEIFNILHGNKITELVFYVDTSVYFEKFNFQSLFIETI